MYIWAISNKEFTCIYWNILKSKNWKNIINIKEFCVLVNKHVCWWLAAASEMVPSRVYYVTENVENFQSKCYHFTATKTPETVSVKQYEHDRVTRCTFSVDFKEIKTISQSLPSPYAICLQPRQSGRHRGEIGTHRLSGTMNFRIRI